MTQPKTAAKPAPAAPTPLNSTLQITCEPGKTDERLYADMVTRGIATNALTAVRYVNPEYGVVSLTDMVASLRDDGEAVNRGDLSNTERLLNAQALTLNAMFAELARRAAINMGEHLGSAETYLRLVLKARSQSRATFETLAAIKNPPVVFVHQANINNGGQQQVNNGTAPTPVQAPHAPEAKTDISKLLEAPNGERLDFGTKSKAGRAHPRLEPLETVNRAEDA